MKNHKLTICYFVSIFTMLTCISANASQLHDAADRGDIEAIIRYQKQGSDLNARDDFNMTALHFAAYGGHMKVIDFLLNNNVEINGQNKMGYTALTLAIDGGHIEVAKKLVKHGADININVDMREEFTYRDKKTYTIKGATALTIAWDKKNIEAVRWLISLGANVNVELEPSTPGVRGSGETLFHKVVSSNNYDMVKLFLEKGANVNAKMHIYDPVYKRAAYIGPLQMTDSSEIKQLLRSYGAK